MTTSAGLLIFDRDALFICKTTNSTRWDIPKGLIDGSELPIEAMLRETREETGAVFQPDEVQDLGLFDYRAGKQLHLFLMIGSNLPKVSECKCISMYRDKVTGKRFPEVCGYSYSNNWRDLLIPKMVASIDKALANK